MRRTVVVSLLLALCIGCAATNARYPKELGDDVLGPLQDPERADGETPVPEGGETSTVGGEAVTAPVKSPHRAGRWQVSVAAGSVENTVDTSPSVSDSTSGAMARFQLEIVPRRFGGGFDLEVGRSDDDLYGGGVEVSWVDAHPFFTYRVLGGNRFRMPIRVGPWMNHVKLEGGGSEVARYTLGGGVELEPEFDIMQKRAFDWSVFVGTGASVGWSYADISGAGGNDDDYFGSAAMFRAELGTRIALSKFLIGLSFVFREFSFGEADNDGGGIVAGMDTGFGGLALTAGMVW